MYKTQLEVEFKRSVDDFKEFYPISNSLLASSMISGVVSPTDAKTMIETYRLIQRINTLADAYQACFKKSPPNFDKADRTFIGIAQACLEELLVTQLCKGDSNE